MKRFKLQFWSFDVVFSVVIFSIALTILAFTWYNISTQLSLSYGGGATLMQLQTQSVATSILSQGSPSNWEGIVNLTNTSTWSGVGIGIGSINGTMISSKKLYAFLAMANYSYQSTKQPLGISYDYYIILYNNNMNITIGKNPSSYNPLSVDVATKSAYINGQPVTMKIILWSNTTFGVS
jgi:hypothetical protein